MIAQSKLQQGFATKFMPTNKSKLCYLVSGKCPYMNASDLIVGETTCDGKKKMYELMADQRDVYVIELPNILNKANKELF